MPCSFKGTRNLYLVDAFWEFLVFKEFSSIWQLPDFLVVWTLWSMNSQCIVTSTVLVHYFIVYVMTSMLIWMEKILNYIYFAIRYVCPLLHLLLYVMSLVMLLNLSYSCLNDTCRYTSVISSTIIIFDFKNIVSLSLTDTDNLFNCCFSPILFHLYYFVFRCKSLFIIRSIFLFLILF